MELNEAEKRQLFQVDGDCQAKVLDELYMTARFTRNPEQRDMVRGLMAKLRVLSNEQCMDLVKDIQKNYRTIICLTPVLWVSGSHWLGSNPGSKS